MYARTAHPPPRTSLVGAFALLVALVLLSLAPVVQAAPITITFSYTGDEQPFVVPAGVTSIHVVAIGGKGDTFDANAGRGAHVEADLPVTPGSTLYINVGGNGIAGGFNGGGQGAGNPDRNVAGNGGGATDIRISSRSDADSLNTRLLVAAGGGGGIAAGDAGQNGGTGPDGGSEAGKGGVAGSSSSGGAGGKGGEVADEFAAADGQAGALGSGGGGGGGADDGDGGGGGGGGYYGGGGGGGTACLYCMSGGAGGGGGGGSSYLSASVSNSSITIDTTGTPLVTISYLQALPASVVINQAAGQADPTSASPILFDVVFSEPVVGFTASDLVLSGSAGGPLSVNVSGGPTTYSVAISGMSSSGTLSANIPADVATSASGVGNTAATSSDNTVTFVAAPTAQDDSYTTQEDSVLNVAAPGVLSNDSDSDANSTLGASVVSGPTNGILTLNADGSFSYTPNANFNGSDSFSYQVSNGSLSDQGTATIIVAPVNDAPTIAVRSEGIGTIGTCPDVHTATATLNLRVQDVDTPTGNLTLQAGSSPFTVSFGGSNANRSATIAATPRLDRASGGALTLTVGDGAGGTASLVIQLLVGHQNNDTLVGTSDRTNIMFGLGSQDTLTGSNLADLICGGQGDNTLNGLGGNDTLIGGQQQDRINGGDGSDVAFGLEGDDTLRGGSGSDRLDGGAGNDQLFGEGSDDRLTGGSGRDLFDGGSGTDRALDPVPGPNDYDSLASIEQTGP